MKRIIYLCLLLMIGSIHYAYGDSEKRIKLDNKEHSRETVSGSHYFNISVELQQVADDEQYQISVKVENISEDKVLCLFDKPYCEKTLKGLKLVFDKSFPGRKGKREIQICDGISEPIILQPSEDTRKFLNIQYKGEPVKFRLPIYIARSDERNFFKKSKVSLTEVVTTDLEIDVEIKPDEEFLRLSSEAESLVEEINQQTFCSNRNHQGTSLRSLYKKYNASIENLKKQVLETIRMRGYMRSDKGYKDFHAIIDKLDAVDLDKLTVSSCTNDKRKPNPVRINREPRCKYCNMSAAAIYKKMEAYYLDIYNGKKTKAQVWSEVQALYDCAHHNKQRTAGSYKSGISKYYNQITKLK